MSPKVAASGMYRIRRYDRFEVKITSNEAAAFYGVMRVLYDDGTDDLFSIPETTLGTDRTVVSFLSDHQATQNGWVVGAHLGILRVPVMRGQIYCRMYLNAAGRTQQMIGAGYLYDDHTINLGDFSEAGPGGGHGHIRTVTGTDPAAGAEIAETIPTNAVWKLLSFGFVMVAAVVAASRVPVLIIDDGTTANRRAVLRSKVAITSGQTRTTLFTGGNDDSQVGATTNTDSDFVITNATVDKEKIGLLLEAYRFRTVTESIQGTDDYAAPIFQVEEWVTAGAS